MKDEIDFFRTIRSNIENHGNHVTLVAGGQTPRFAYTIGCSERFGAELILAGGEFYSKNEVTAIIKRMVDVLRNGAEWQTLSLSVESLGSFSLSITHESWSKIMALGVFDFYKQDGIKVLQILPDEEHHTLDIPDMSTPFDAASQPVWQWLVREWNYAVPRNATVVTDLSVLFGEKATEVMRWDEDGWEIFSDDPSNMAKENMRALPLAILIGIDKSLEPAVYLEVGRGFYRDRVDLTWKDWV
ncbi:protein of unknown function [Chryseolinea serpens]|uniref:DUF4262 domain-containing protein n=1 Tax=Chryseolinea serpens TaxID=947013 RepID=A0A1M5KTD4_9BACT|nr:DUF4262 domain-containing protein [Chryseolinea serpens]SHG55930.1 protein of unknown function [Chryseolinea serpens]